MNDEKLLAQIDRWREELVDLTLRNRLLNFKPTKSSSLEIVEPSLTQVLTGLWSTEGWRFHYPPQADIEGDDAVRAALESEDPDLDDELKFDELLTTTTKATDLSRTLHNLERRASQELLDKGLRILYLGFGMLEWSDAEGASLNSPLVLVPVALQRSNPRAPYRLTGTDEDLIANPALAIKLDRDFGLSLPEPNSDDFSLDGYLAQVEQQLRSSEIPAGVSQRLVLSCFSFHKEAMYRDLQMNEDIIAEHPVVQALALGTEADVDLSFEPPVEENLDELAPPEQLKSILDADATQRRCIVAASEGRTFVMDGPPGTGKSQTIANIIAELLGAGRKVLFVSEKAAALEVVKARLDDCNLGSFVLELHSHKATRKEVALALSTALTERPRAKSPMTRADISRVEDRRRRLSSYAAAVNEVREPLGMTVFDAIGRRAALDELPSAPRPEPIGVDLDISDFNALLDAARGCSGSWGPVERGSEFLWRDLADPRTASSSTTEIRSELRRATTANDDLSTASERTAIELALDLPLSIRDAELLLAVLRLIDERPPVPTAWLTEMDQERVSHRIDELRALSADYAGLWAQLNTWSAEWASIPPDAAALAIESIAAIGRLEPELDLRPCPFDIAKQFAEFALDAHERMGAANEDLRQLAGALGVSMPNAASLSDLERFDALCQLGLARFRPLEDWFDESAIVRVRESINVLLPLAEEHRACWSELAEVFTEDLARLDVESLYASPNDVTPRLGRLSSAGRKNRRDLRSCTKGGTLDASITAMLPLARKWQANRLRLEQAEAEHKAVLGHYYAGPERTDFPSISEAVETAERALSLAGGDVDRVELGRALGIDSKIAGSLASKAADASNLLRTGLARGLDLVGPTFTRAFEQPISQAISWLSDAGRNSSNLCSTLSPVAKLGAGTERLQDLIAIAEQRAQLTALIERIANSEPSDSDLLGPLYHGLETDWDQVQSAFEWAHTMRGLLGNEVDDFTAQRLLDTPLQSDELDLRFGEVEKALQTIEDLFLPGYAHELTRDLRVSFDAARQLLADLDSTLGDIDEWAAFNDNAQALRTGGLGCVVDYCTEQTVNRSQVADIVERSLLSAWIDAQLSADKRLVEVRSADRDRLVEEYRQLDAMLRYDAAARVVNECTAQRPTTIAGTAGVIAREGLKKKRHMPIRELLTRAGSVALACKPCFMMSPLSVSQYLPADLTFDAVVFDEASQMRPCDAINAIYRGSQLIVAGDEKQLPPTSFFDRVTNDDDDTWDEEQLDEFESVLQSTKATGLVPSLPLQWHYRSAHEALITYSNYSFYDGKLVTYPGSISIGSDVGVVFEHVPDGVYARGAGRDNAIEAKRVVERVLWFADNHPDLTLGVVALSEAQASRIEFELEYARRQRPDLDNWFQDDRLDGFFVKNLESVQGDERDVIILSIGYGRDENGKLTMNFGPINPAGGWRRLNVAVTRARRRVELVSSITAGEITETGSPGVAHLKRYLDYAQRGMPALALDLTDSEGDAESPFEEEVLRVLRRWGYDAVPQVGTAGYRIDIAIRHPERPGEYLIGIECDGAAYHSSRVVRDRDRLRQEVLERLGWSLHRIWGPAWYRGRPDEEVRLRAAIERALTGEVEEAATVVTSREPIIEIDEVDFDAPPEWTTPYVLAQPRASSHFRMDEPLASSALETAILKVVDVEGPVARDLVEQRVREAWGAGRMGARMQDAFTSALYRLRARDLIEWKSRFLDRPSGDMSTVRRATDDPATVRRVSNIPPQELSLALFNTIRDAHQIDDDELATRVARLFGWSRRGADIQAAIDSSVRKLMTSARVMRRTDGSLGVAASDGD